MTPQLPTGCVIAVLGAESSGKTELTGAIARRLNQRGVACVEVHEYLRDRCDREGRTPRPDEQNAIAAEQSIRRIADAAAQASCWPTPCPMTAIYSDMLFDDPSLYDAALATQRGYAITLVTALDLPWAALQRDGPHVREPSMPGCARHSTGPACPFGRARQRSGSPASAWNAINLIAGCARSTGSGGQYGTESAWTWPCEKCSIRPGEQLAVQRPGGAGALGFRHGHFFVPPFATLGCSARPSPPPCWD